MEVYLWDNKDIGYLRFFFLCVIIKFKGLDKMNGVMIKHSNKNLQKKIKKPCKK